MPQNSRIWKSGEVEADEAEGAAGAEEVDGAVEAEEVDHLDRQDRGKCLMISMTGN